MQTLSKSKELAKAAREVTRKGIDIIGISETKKISTSSKRNHNLLQMRWQQPKGSSRHTHFKKNCSSTNRLDVNKWKNVWSKMLCQWNKTGNYSRVCTCGWCRWISKGWILHGSAACIGQQEYMNDIFKDDSNFPKRWSISNRRWSTCCNSFVVKRFSK